MVSIPDGRKHFIRVWHELESLREWWRRICSPEGGMNAELHEEARALFAAKFPRKKQPKEMAAVEKACGAEGQALREKWMSRATRTGELYVELRREMLDQLSQIALFCRLVPGEEWSLYQRIPSSSYHTVDCGGGKYARVRAELYAEDARYYGIEAEVRENEDGYRRFEVWIRTGEWDRRILEYKDGLPMREAVRRCWAMGANPRVYWPFLELGFEEREEIDYFGRDLRKAA